MSPLEQNKTIIVGRGEGGWLRHLEKQLLIP